MTFHKSQGGKSDDVLLVLPAAHTERLSQQEILEKAMKQRMQQMSGLQERLKGREERGLYVFYDQQRHYLSL